MYLISKFKQEAHGACIAHMFSPPKLLKVFAISETLFEQT